MLGRNDSSNPYAPRGSDLGLPLGEKLVRKCFRPYVPEFPNVGFLRHTFIGPEFGCVVCKKTWVIEEALFLYDSGLPGERVLKTFEEHRHDPEPEVEPLDPSGVPLILETK
jgi:hypothetical protein